MWHNSQDKSTNRMQKGDFSKLFLTQNMANNLADSMKFKLFLISLIVFSQKFERNINYLKIDESTVLR